MPSTKTIISIVLIITAILAIFFAYRFFLAKFKGPEEAPGLTRELNRASTSAPDAAKEFLNVLLNLQRIELKDDFFKTPFFRSLVDFSPDLAAQIPGRADPFAPVTPTARGGR